MSKTSLGARSSAAPATTIPYHRLARTDGHRWWRTILGTLLVVAALPVLLVGGFGEVNDVLRALVESPQQAGISGAGVALTLATLALLIPTILLAARWIQRRVAGTVSSVTGRLRWRWLGSCLLLAVSVLAFSYGVVNVVVEPVEITWIGWDRFMIFLAVLAVLVPLQAAGAEYLFRGWLLQALGVWIRSPWPGIALSAVLFGLAHGYSSGWNMFSMIFFGAVAAVVTIRTGGLEAAIALHVVNNVVSFGLAVFTGAPETQQIAGSVPALPLLADIVVVMVYGEAVVWLAGRRRIQTNALPPVGSTAADGGPGAARPVAPI